MTKRTKFLICILVLLFATSLSASPLLREVSNDMVLKSAGSSVIKGVDDWLFLKDELLHLGAGKFWGESAATAGRSKNKTFADPVPAIVEYNKLLAEKGIKLYLMPVPPKALVYPDKLAGNIGQAVAAEDRKLYTEFYNELEKSGVRTIDLLPTLVQQRDTKQLYCKTDTHFTGEGLALFAKAAAKAIKAEDWYAVVPKKEYLLSPQKVKISGDLAQMAGGTGPEEELELTIVKTKADSKLVASDPESPVILLGDSHALVFSAGGDLHAKGAGLFDHLSAQLGFPVDLLGVRGSGVTPARIKLFQRSKKDQSYLEGKKALIWCFTARDFTGTGGWKKIPAAP